MKQYIIDAFTDRVFAGNPAAVCITDSPLSERQMTAIAIENNLSETAFSVAENGGYRLRWFTPGGEIDLCGHATLACAYAVLRFYEPQKNCVRFQTASDMLTVVKNGDLYEMDFPSYELKKVKATDAIRRALGVCPTEVWRGRDLVCVLENERQVFEISPNLQEIKELEGLLLHVTARGTEFDCVSRTFAPKCGIDEDPVCGSGHCHIVPLWAQKLNKAQITAYQASKRGGTLYCAYAGDRVKLAGKAALYAVSELFLD